MQEKSLQEIKALLSAFLEVGFQVEYLQQKGGDSSCVYIYRFKKGSSFFDWRETSGTDEIHFVVYTGGAYAFPSIEKRNKKLFQSFQWKHLFKRATIKEKRELFAKALTIELNANPNNFFGIPI